MNEPKTMPKEAFSMLEISELVGVHYDTVRRAVASGAIESFRFGRLVRVRRDVVRRFIANQRKQAEDGR